MMRFDVAVERRGEQLVVVKRALADNARAMLAHEAAVLERLAHPGLVELVAFTSSEWASELVTKHAGAMTLADYSPATEAAVARIGAGVAATLADLHAAGLCHRHLAADHVILSDGPHALVCSLGHTTDVGDGGDRDDLDALCSILIALAESCPPARGRAARRARQGLRSAIETIATEDATAARLASALARVPGARDRSAEQPGSRAVAGAQEKDKKDKEEEAPVVPGDERAAPDARTWRDRVAAAPAEAPDSSWPWSKVPVGAWVGAAVMLACLGWAAVAAVGGNPRTPTVPAQPVAQVRVHAAPDVADAGTTPTVLGACDRRPAPIGCADDTDVSGPFVRVGGRWFELATLPDDEVFVGDWNCDGVRTSAVLRPATGEVFVFEAWAEQTMVEAPPSAWVPPGRHGKIATRNGCDQLLTLTTTGKPEPVALP